jgi:hypothetical protein
MQTTNPALTASLFVDAPGPKGEDVKFSLYEDHSGLINARKTFVEIGDPTGYNWAIQYLNSWRHFEKLMGCSWFREAYDSYVREINEKHRASALGKIKEIADDGIGPSALSASKYLAEEGWVRKETKAGRPSKESLDQAVKQHVLKVKEIDLDAQRIGLH